MLSYLQGAMRFQRERAAEPTVGGGARRKVPLDLAVGRFLIKTAGTDSEFKAVMDLRKEVFHHEFARRRFSFRSDRDAYDDAGDLLMIYDQEAGRVAGTYRLITSTHSDIFYSATEYWIDGLLTLPGVKLELSRACIHKDYRNGATIRMLWKGIAEYAKAVGADYLFGLSSVSTLNVPEIVAMYRMMQNAGQVDLGLNVIPRQRFAIKDFPKAYGELHRLAVFSEDRVDAMIPALLKSYFKAGAKICSHPVIDPAFKCADFLTILPIGNLHPSYARKFMGSSAQRVEA